MYKIAVIGDYDSIYGFATLGLSICPVKTREDARKKLKQLADGQYGIIYITEAVAAQIEEEIEQYREDTGRVRQYGSGSKRCKEDRGTGGRFGYSVWRSKLMSTGVIKKVAGPLVIAEGMRDANMFDVVRVSNQRLIGEIIEMHGDEASIQVYEETSGLGPGEPGESMEVPMFP